MPKGGSKKPENEEYKKRSVEEYFFASLKGNLYTHASQLLDIKRHISDWFQFDLSTTSFQGVVGGDVPFYDGLYRADVHELKLQASVNITTTLAIEVLKLARFEISVDIVPAVATASASAYTSSLLEDNCGWLLYGW